MQDIAIYESEVLAKNCQFTKNKLIIDEGTSFEDWQRMGEMLRTIRGSVQFWIGDWLRFGERKYGEMYSQALETTDYEYGTLKDAKWVADRVEMSLRKDNLSFNHHKEVARLQPDEQKYWLDKAESVGLSVRDLRREIRESIKKACPPLSNDKYDVIYADPFTDEKSLTLEDICNLEVPAAEDSVLFLWTPPQRFLNALEVTKAWGFEYKTHAVWDKGISGDGIWFRERHELMIVATKGNFPPPSRDEIVDSILNNEPALHGQGRGLIYGLIELIYPGHRYLVLFRQNNRENWDNWGLEE